MRSAMHRQAGRRRRPADDTQHSARRSRSDSRPEERGEQCDHGCHHQPQRGRLDIGVGRAECGEDHQGRHEQHPQRAAITSCRGRRLDDQFDGRADRRQHRVAAHRPVRTDADADCRFDDAVRIVARSRPASP